MLTNMNDNIDKNENDKNENDKKIEKNENIKIYQFKRVDNDCNKNQYSLNELFRKRTNYRVLACTKIAVQDIEKYCEKSKRHQIINKRNKKRGFCFITFNQIRLYK